jgi:hypothetical protein
MKAAGANRMIEWLGHAGAALEHQTLLGRILRIAIDPRDPMVQASYKDIHRQTKVGAENKINSFRGVSAQVLNKGYELVMALLKAGSPSKEVVTAWLVEALAQNKEASKGHPNQMACSSIGMLGNVAALSLRLCKPYMNDTEKLKKIDWSFISHSDSHDIVPREETKLASLSAPTTTEAPLHEGEYTFMTQSFFIGWRALHLGFVSQYSQYEGHMRRLHHFHSNLMNDEPQAVSMFMHKMVIDTIILTPEYLESAVAYCTSASTCLVDVLNGAEKNSDINSVKNNWFVPESGNLFPRNFYLTIPP